MARRPPTTQSPPPNNNNHEPQVHSHPTQSLPLRQTSPIDFHPQVIFLAARRRLRAWILLGSTYLAHLSHLNIDLVYSAQTNVGYG